MLLVLDNYDSFTWNLVQLLGELGADPVVVRNDELTVEELLRRRPDRVVVSPGPCTPTEAGISVEAIRTLAPLGIPVLGVCLGHQALGEAFGGRTIRAGQLMHGKVASIEHTGEGIFSALPSPFRVARYHSLVTDPAALPDELEVVAWSSVAGTAESSASNPRAREIQAVRHRNAPVWGVQFHPESYFSEHGRALLDGFLHLRGAR
ncbi:MAG: aminodeoxychorismate/anthranilate synthase component II [Gemmatimonadales bacterium]|nr:MAG: aminodeoxychorismate/anthranilate synthase component II [Gemmatimonadales bacterium]